MLLIAECNKHQNCIHLVESLLDNWLKNNHITVDITVFCFGGKLELHSTSLPSTSGDVYNKYDIGLSTDPWGRLNCRLHDVVHFTLTTCLHSQDRTETS